MEPEELIVAARWVRTQLEAHDNKAASGALGDRLETYREREGQGSMLRPLFDAALLALGASNSREDLERWTELIDAAESAVGGMPQVRAWLEALMQIIGDGDVATPGASTAVETSITPAADAREHARTPSLEEMCRALVRSAAPAVAEAEDTSGARWGIDFGTAWSKTALRRSDGVVEELAKTTRSQPSIVAVERHGDRILFGEKAADVSRAARAWNVSTSIKRFLVGKRIDVAGMPNEMSTERLAVLYVAWLIHQGHQFAGDDLSPFSLTAHLSLPLARVGDQPQLREFFSGGIMAPKRYYRDWLHKAFRMAQLVAVTYRGEAWPESVSELLTVLQLWDRYDWSKVRRQVGVISEPAAVIGDFEPLSLAEGLTMLVDCGAGTTDVSVFWRQGDRVFRVIEHSAVVGGDTIDGAIAAAVVARHPELQELRNNVTKWARDAKPQLLADGAVDFDPELVLDVRDMLPSRIDLRDVQSGLDDLGEGVQAVVQAAVRAAEEALVQARPSGVTAWPQMSDLRGAWYSGGSAVVSAVPLAIDAALAGEGVPMKSGLLAPPPTYSAWSPDRYRTMSCAAGASRRELLRPEDLQPDRPAFSDAALSQWDKDAG
ncbi:MAG: rod shape-determining protein [Alphaproteobacteria bacterium]|nr:rod shape-determining protein [Alphaproteobacteria bacterium]